MPSEFDLHKATKEGDEARAFLESDVISKRLDHLRQNYIDQLIATDVTQDSFREKCWMMVRCVDVFREHLTIVVNNGVVAKSDLERLAREGERKKRFGIV